MGRSVKLVCLSKRNQVGVELSEESAALPLASVVYTLILDPGSGLYIPLHVLHTTLSADTLIVCAMTLSQFNIYVGVYVCMCNPKYVKPLEQLYCLKRNHFNKTLIVNSEHVVRFKVQF